MSTKKNPVTKCSHAESLFTAKGCMGCVGELAAAVVYARWGEALSGMSTSERRERAPEIAGIMQAQVIEETDRILEGGESV